MTTLTSPTLLLSSVKYNTLFPLSVKFCSFSYNVWCLWYPRREEWGDPTAAWWPAPGQPKQWQREDVSHKVRGRLHDIQGIPVIFSHVTESESNSLYQFDSSSTLNLDSWRTGTLFPWEAMEAWLHLPRRRCSMWPSVTKDLTPCMAREPSWRMDQTSWSKLWATSSVFILMFLPRL